MRPVLALAGLLLLGACSASQKADVAKACAAEPIVAPVVAVEAPAAAPAVVKAQPVIDAACAAVAP